VLPQCRNGSANVLPEADTPLGRRTLACRAKTLRFHLLQHSGQVAEWLKARAWRAGEGNPKLETEFTLFT